MGKHVEGYVINGRSITIHRSMHSHDETKVIDPVHYNKLILVLKKYKHLLNMEKESMREKFPYGGVNGYKFDFDGKVNMNEVWPLFVSEDRKVAEEACSEFAKVISEIITA